MMRICIGKNLKVILISFLVSISCLIGFLGAGAKADSAVELQSQQPIELKSTYNDISANEMNTIDEICSEYPNTRKIVNTNGTITLETILPTHDDSVLNQMNTIINKDSGFNDPNIKTVNFEDYTAAMDSMNGESNFRNGQLVLKKYKGQKPGERVKKGTHVHCNRFNGPHADHKYWGKYNPEAWIDYVGSDCDEHAEKYNCYTMPFGSSGKCDGLNSHGHGVHNCSAWKSQKKRHHNWSFTAWYRN